MNEVTTFIDFIQHCAW